MYNGELPERVTTRSVKTTYFILLFRRVTLFQNRERDV